VSRFSQTALRISDPWPDIAAVECDIKIGYEQETVIGIKPLRVG
jgi:hypothetical protein